ncbi:hypothetical protein SPSIL_053600 [Sporomusa silvacetica DSM 10669]|uniref:Spo0E like sporulation regulatory protein n=1 Tax=Sporomusa silvacetica DSM 10669 TaxID=1123289 RepID=A0ABZ3ITT7_9FIRM|nr:hypothetical protein [Sporomusa silvacetica]OZC19551.1 hypothetical protein SPSIL_19790 [Sporomusa silvacetica DSM 10669]
MKTLSLLKQISQIADELYNGTIDSATKTQLLNRLEKLSVNYMNLRRELHIKNDNT